jgi:hypothetical protein
VTTPGAASDWVAHSLRGARVLIVDDDPLQCSHLAQVMKEWDGDPKREGRNWVILARD